MPQSKINTEDQKQDTAESLVQAYSSWIMIWNVTMAHYCWKDIYMIFFHVWKRIIKIPKIKCQGSFIIPKKCDTNLSVSFKDEKEMSINSFIALNCPGSSESR